MQVCVTTGPEGFEEILEVVSQVATLNVHNAYLKADYRLAPSRTGGQ